MLEAKSFSLKYEMNLRFSPLCNQCGIEESNIHLFLYCQKVQQCINWLKKLIYYLCNIDISNNLLKCLFLDFPKVSKDIQNTLCIIICSYIYCVWYNRDKQEIEIVRFKTKLIKVQKSHMLIYKDKAKDLFTENYCYMRLNVLNYL